MSKTNPKQKGTPIALSSKSQMDEGLHVTFNDVNVGDVLKPSSELGRAPTSSMSETDKTYFAPPQAGRPMVEQYMRNVMEGRDMDGRKSGRARFLTTHPTQDQQLDGNYSRDYIRGSLQHSQVTGAITPVRDAINKVKSSAPRMSSSQEVTEVNWGPPPGKGEWVEPSLPYINWRQFGGQNFRTNINTPRGVTSYDDAGFTSEHFNEETLKEFDSAIPRKPEIPGQMDMDDIPGFARVNDSAI